MAEEMRRDSEGRFTGIPLVNRLGEEPKVVGTADVKLVDGVFEVSMDITDEEMKKLFRPKPGEFSIIPDTFRED
jgi:hypothetical protein